MDIPNVSLFADIPFAQISQRIGDTLKHCFCNDSYSFFPHACLIRCFFDREDMRGLPQAQDWAFEDSWDVEGSGP